MKLNTKEREILLRKEFECSKGDDVFFTVKKHIYRGIVVDLIPKNEEASDYFTKGIIKSNNKCNLLKNNDGLNRVLLCVMTGKFQNVTTYYAAIDIMHMEKG